MIKVLAEVMTSCYDSSLKVKILEFKSLEDIKQEVLKHLPKVSVSVPREGKEFWFGIQYGDTADGFWFRWLKAIMDTERGCLYSLGDVDCATYMGLPRNKQHCSAEVYTLLVELEKESKQREVVFVD